MLTQDDAKQFEKLKNIRASIENSFYGILYILSKEDYTNDAIAHGWEYKELVHKEEHPTVAGEKGYIEYISHHRIVEAINKRQHLIYNVFGWPKSNELNEDYVPSILEHDKKISDDVRLQFAVKCVMYDLMFDHIISSAFSYEFLYALPKQVQDDYEAVRSSGVVKNIVAKHMKTLNQNLSDEQDKVTSLLTLLPDIFQELQNMSLHSEEARSVLDYLKLIYQVIQQALGYIEKTDLQAKNERNQEIRTKNNQNENKNWIDFRNSLKTQITQECKKKSL